MDAADHRKISDSIDDRLTRVNAVYARIAGQQFDLHILSFCHYVLSAIPNAAFIELHVTDQGGDYMTFRHVGVLRADYDAWTDDRSYSAVKDSHLQVDLVTIHGQEFVLVDESYDIFNTINEDGSAVITEDAVHECASGLDDADLIGHPFWEQTGGRRSGTGRLWVATALETLEPTYEGFIKGALDPIPDPTDKVALAAWLADETAPEEEQRLCGCGGRHNVHPDDDEES